MAKSKSGAVPAAEDRGAPLAVLHEDNEGAGSPPKAAPSAAEGAEEAKAAAGGSEEKRI